MVEDYFPATWSDGRADDVEPGRPERSRSIRRAVGPPILPSILVPGENADAFPQSSAFLCVWGTPCRRSCVGHRRIDQLDHPHGVRSS